MKKSLTLILAFGLSVSASAATIPTCNDQTHGDRIAVPDQKLIEAAMEMGWTREEAELHDGSVRLVYCTLVPVPTWLRSASEEESFTLDTLQTNSEYRWVLL
jgi:hypothetical protein